ncbi:hypothetical protein CTRI78_v005234 [Colletotrichum trifolii]|uniref:Uncharacterized protein n=1 Tax=Colletotrichum trifolii TaxID=5466 RepID=A0A4R8RIF6_COLTR|nr:hypothetical protein CTRI78_v005234 [Colletotrichum trifolii]
MTRGYQNGEEPVVKVEIDVYKRKMVVEAAYNAEDKTPSRLHLNQVLEYLWEAEGGELERLLYIEYAEIDNEATKVVLQNIRTRRQLAATTGFKVKPRMTSEDWAALVQSPFGKVSRRMATAGGTAVKAFKIQSRRFSPTINLWNDYLTVKLG